MPKKLKSDPSHGLLFVGTYGHVVALNKKNGRKVWETSLPKTGYSVVSILPEEGLLHCASGGHVFALDPLTGEILWTNGLRGLGKGVVFLSTMQSNNMESMSLLAAQVQANAAAASSAAS